MLIRIKRHTVPASAEVTPPEVFRARRRFLATGAAGAGAVLLPGLLGPAGLALAESGRALDFQTGIFPAPKGEDLTDRTAATGYNNFYELGSGKEDPARNARRLRTEPWSVTVDGLVRNPGKIAFEDLIAPHGLEERIYRMRCVEAWSMVIPWVGFELGALLDRFEPLGHARYVAFETIFDPKMLPVQATNVLPWPYREGLRLDEARHPLTILAVGMYGEVLPNQNGAPIRLVVPWKYGFKSIKSIVRITLTEEMPKTTWSMHAPREYGFYANVNPEVDHPRWSQAKERRIGEFLRRPTLMFNGYGDEVAHLYAGQDLAKDY